MPFDLVNLRPYQFDYHNMLKQYIEDRNLISFRSHLIRWEELIIKSDQITRCNIPDIIQAYQASIVDDQIYQIPFEFLCGEQFIFQFNVTRMLASIVKCNGRVDIRQVPASYFLGNESCFHYSSITDVSRSFLIDEPILAVPFFNGNTQYEIIDGNHRLSAHIKYKSPLINVNVVTPIAIDYFGTPVDYSMYIFFLEFSTILNFFIGKYSASEIIKNSMLPTVESQLNGF
jgi:hypothetical protein